MATEKMTAQVVVQVDKGSVTQAQQDLARLTGPTWIKLATDLASLRKSLQDVNKEIKLAAARWDFTAELQLRANAEVLKKQINIANRELQNFTRTGSTEVSVLWKLFEQLWNRIWWRTGSLVSWLWQAKWMAWWLSWALTTLATWAILAGVTTLWTKAIMLADGFEQASISFEVMLWSEEKAINLLKDLSQFAKQSPFELLGIRQSAKQLLAFGIDAENLIPTLKVLGDVASGTGTGLDRIAYAFWQVRAAWRLTGNELRQFTEAWVPLIDELAKLFWVTAWEIKEMVSEWTVWFNDVQQAFVNMTSEWGKFFNMMERQTTTLSGKISNLKDKFNQLLEETWWSLTPFAKIVVDSLSWLLSAFSKTLLFVSLWTQSLVSAFVDLAQNISTAIYSLWQNVAWWFKDLVENSKILASNIWTAFSNIPAYIWKFLNAGIIKLEEFLNKASEWVSNFAKKFGVDLWLWKVSLWKISWGWEVWWYKSFVNTNRKIADENIKIAQDQFAKDRKIRDLALQMAATDLDKKLNTERKLNFEMKKLNDDTTKDKEKSWKAGADNEKKLAKEKEQLQKDALENVKDILKEEISAQKEAIKETEKWIEKLQDAVKEFDKINEKIADVGKNAEEKIAERFNTITEKITDVKDKLSDFTREQISWAESIWRETLWNMNWSDSFWEWITVDDLREYLDLKKELADLQAEQALAKANTTESAIALDQVSETQKILNEAAARKADLEQEKLDIEAKLGLKEEQVAAELLILQNQKIEQEKMMTDYQTIVDTAEAEITAITKKNTEDRLALYAIEEARLRRLIELRRQAGMATAASSWTTNNTVNNSPNVTVNANVASWVDVNNLGNTLAKKITLSSKGIN